MKKYIVAVIVCALTIVSCVDDDYKIDGGVSSPYVNMSTYDYLKSNRLFDTLVMAIDKAGLRNELDTEVTLFATTHFTFRNYINLMTERGRPTDPNYEYTFDSIPVEILRDSLAMYIFPGKIERGNMTKEGEIFTNLAGTELRISLEPRDDYKDQLKEKPEYVFLTYKRGKAWDAWDATGLGNVETDTKDRIQTSGLISTTGIIHVMQNSHILFFDRK